MLSFRTTHLPLDGPQYPTKTPNRLKNRGENAGVKTVGPKGKSVVAGTPAHALKGGFATVSKSRPFLDKTPFPNRQQPNFEGGNEKDALGKLPKLVFLETKAQSSTPEILRPSSTRKHARLPRSADRNFKTPANKGNHWDVSDISLDVADAQAEQLPIEQEDYDEIEYMAPNTLDLPYQPPFDFELPDYKSLARDFRKVVFSPVTDDHKPVFEDPVLLAIQPMASLPLKDIPDDDPFYQPQAKAAIPRTVQAVRAPVRRPMSTVPPATSTSTAKPRVLRPATSMATKIPAPPTRGSGKPVVSAARLGSRVQPGGKPNKPQPPTNVFDSSNTFIDDAFLFSV